MTTPPLMALGSPNSKVALALGASPATGVSFGGLALYWVASSSTAWIDSGRVERWLNLIYVESRGGDKKCQYHEPL